MGELIVELLKVIGLIYCTIVGLMMIVIYLFLLIRLTDYAIHSDDYNDFDDKEQKET